MKRIITAIMGAAAILASAAVTQAQELNFIFVSHGQANDPFHSIVKNGAFQAGEDLGVKVDYRSPQTFNMVQMAQLVDAAVNQEPDGLIVTIADPDALGSSIKRASEAGIPVIAVNSGKDVARDLGAMLYVGQDEHLAGVEAGKRLKALGGKKGLCINVEPGNVTLDIRCSGFAEGFGRSVDVLPTSLDPADVQAKVRAALESDPQIDTILTTSALIAGEPSLKAIAGAGRDGEVHLASFDLSAGMLKAVADGQVEFLIDQQQYMYGYLPVALLKLYNDTGTIPVNDVLSGPRFVEKDQASQVIELSSQGIR